MINITRNTNPPLSLQTIEIQTYIDDCVRCFEDATLKKPDPPTSYRNSDLLTAFDRDFLSKCYMTEMKFANSWSMDIEHFIPKSEHPELTYEWDNLYPSHHYSNMLKPRTTPPGGYLDPCDLNDDVETEILYSMSAIGEEPYFEPRDPQNLKAVNTCHLLNRVHNGHDFDTNKATADLRQAIHKKYIDILNKIIQFRSWPPGTPEHTQHQRELRDFLSRRSSFTMLCRSIPAVQQLPIEFLNTLD